MKTIEFSSLFYVALKHGPLMFRGDFQGEAGLGLPLFEKRGIAIPWVRNYPHPDHKVVAITSRAQFSEVLEAAHKAGCEWIVWDRHPDDEDGHLMRMRDLVHSVRTDPDTN